MSRLKQLQDRKRYLELLLENKTYQEIMAGLEAQVRLRKAHAFEKDIRSLDDAFEVARLKGEVAGMLLALRYADMLMDDIKADLEDELTRVREEDQNVG